MKKNNNKTKQRDTVTPVKHFWEMRKKIQKVVV